MSYKIAFYHSWPLGSKPTKDKHKLYDSKETYDRWWIEHHSDCQRRNFGGLVGYVNGEIDRVFGDLPEAIITQYNEKQNLKS